MSFEIVCPGCGAPSGPSVGVCPFCKAIFGAHGETDGVSDPSAKEIASISQLYEAGNLKQALSMGTLAADEKEMQSNVDFMILFAKILIEAEGPIGKVKGLLGKAHLLDPANQNVTDYLDIAEAIETLSGVNSAGEALLKSVLRRSPANIHALFLLGTHEFWAEKELIQSAKLLEKAVQLHPKFLRAWGCLGAIYQRVGNLPLARRAFQNCVALETDPSMKEFFQQQMTTTG